MEVHDISDEENGERVVVLSCEDYLSNTTLLRHQNAQLIFHTYSGIRVPGGGPACVVTDVITDEDGNQTEVSATAGVLPHGPVGPSQTVKVLYQGEDYYLVEADTESLSGMGETQRESRILRGGDEVILTASDLYDGR